MTTAYELLYVRTEEEPILDPPSSNVGVIGWLRGNLFSSATNIILTLLGIALVLWIVPPLIKWAFVDAVWTGPDREVCVQPGAGACWAFVHAKFAQFMYGSYPLDERWRVNLAGILLVIGIIPIAIPRLPFKRETTIYLFGLYPLIALILLTGGHFDIGISTIVALILTGLFLTGLIVTTAGGGQVPVMTSRVALISAAVALVAAIASLFIDSAIFGIGGYSLTIIGFVAVLAAVVSGLAGLAGLYRTPGRPGQRAVGSVWMLLGGIIVVLLILSVNFGLEPVETQLWGGLLVTLVVALVGIASSMPIGIILALGRRSMLPVIKFCSIVFIEFVRGVPLITVLFMASVMLPVFLPTGVNFDKLLRALIGVALFSSAYMAEVVRGGLQAIPKGQYEAAAAMGLGYWQMMRLIILPQALKIVIPGIVNSFIALFKDTSLVLIIGLFDLLGIVQRNFTDPDWASSKTPATGYVFAAAVFWAFCFGMSRYSIYTERRLHTGHKR